VPARTATTLLTIGDALRIAAAALPNSATPRLDAEVLLAHALRVTRSALLARMRQPLPTEHEAAFEILVVRRAAGEPVSYITGWAHFYGLTLAVGPGVLIPRPETELLADWAVERARSREGRLAALDIGTGSGAIALALAASVDALHVVATDTSPVAVSTATRNAARLGISERVLVYQADLLPPEPARFDLVVANLPYVGTADPDLAPDVRLYEPAEALFAGPDGLALIRRLLGALPPRLAPGADLGFEIGWRQGPAVVALTRAALPGADVRLDRDLAGHDRLVTAVGIPCEG